jgi:SAM-dependent methyltransferase
MSSKLFRALLLTLVVAHCALGEGQTRDPGRRDARPTLESIPVQIGATGGASDSSPAPVYEYRAPTRDGIGKIYMGREIAKVMGHQGAGWLERPARETEEKPEIVVRALNLKRGDVVADIGAGTGYFSWRMAREIGPAGKVHAVEIQQEMLDILSAKMAGRGVENVVPVLGTITDPKLPDNSVDLALMVDVYHEFSHPYEMMQAICRALKPGGRVAFVEYRAEDPEVPIKPLHKMSEAQIRAEAEVHALVWSQSIHDLPWQHLIIFQKPERPVPEE